MANLSESPAWVNGIYQLETTDPVLGGPDGVDNLQAKQLANRTGFLKKQIDDAVSGALTVMYANKLKTPRSISMTGDATWTTSFDGSANVSAAISLSNSGATPGTYKSVTVDAKGRVTAGTNPTTLAGYGITDGVSTANYTATDVLNKIKTVDGAGSGLDADLLDGKDSTHFLDLANSTGVLPNARLQGIYSDITLKNGANNALIKEGGNYVRTVTDLVQYRGPATVTGAIVFLAPAGLTTAMHTLHVLGFDYSATPKSLDFVVQGYRTTGAWSRQVLTHSGAHKPIVRLGRKAGTDQSAIIIGDVTDTWSYPHLAIVKALFSHTGATDAYCTGWSSDVVTDLSAYDNVLTITDASKLEWSQITNIPATLPSQNISGNAGTATKLATARTISLTGDATGSVAFDGSANASMTVKIGGIKQLSSAATMDTTYAGKLTILTGTTFTVNLPIANTYQSGTSLTFYSAASGIITINRAASDVISVNNAFGVNSLPLGSGDTLTLISNGNNVWEATSGSAQLGYSANFQSNKSSNGYQKLPGGLIIQWGSDTSTINRHSVVFPIAFPTGALSITVSGSPHSSSGHFIPANMQLTKTGYVQYFRNAAGAEGNAESWDGRYIAIGY